MTREEILNLDINTHGISTQEDMMIEECSELTKALLKLRRYHNSSLVCKTGKRRPYKGHQRRNRRCTDHA